MLSRFRRCDDGSVAVLAAVTFPVVLLCVALALAGMVWTSSEQETQRAADTAAVRAAATAFLGADFPYGDLPGLTTPLAYPDVAAIAAWAGVAPPADLAECGTVGVPPSSLTKPLTVTAALDLPLDCTPVGPFAVPPPLTAVDSTREVACSTARDAMAADRAKYGTRFFSGEGDAQPSCDKAAVGGRRIGVKLATGSPLVGFGEYAADTATGLLDTQVAPQLGTLAGLLAAFGVRLETALPSLICPEISVTVDQPVREPVFDRSTPANGSATARRIVKNAVVVPVFQGESIESVATASISASTSGAGIDVTSSSGGVVRVPPVNLNSQLLAAQQQMLTLLDEIDAVIDSVVRQANVTVDELNGVWTGVDPDEPNPLPTAGAAPLEGLRLTKCLRDTIAQVYDPPSGDAPTADEVLADAAANGEQVVVVQVGAVRAACTEPGAIASVFAAVGNAGECVRAATAAKYDPTSLLYEVPFFDVTPVLVQDLGDHNYAAVPVHASQASGAFRAGLVRDKANERFDPDVRQPKPTPACDVTLPAPTPATACQVLSHSPAPLPTLPLPTLPVPTPTLSPLPTLTPVPTLPTLPTSPLPTLPLPTTTVPTVPCVGLLCGKTK